MLRTVFAWAFIGGTSLLLGSCGSLLLPRFDGGVLNPDIRFLNAGDMMNGMKCAMTAFMLEREENLLQERRNAIMRRKFSDADSRRFLLLYGAEYKKTYGGIVARIGTAKAKAENQRGVDNEFNPHALGLDDEGLKKQIYAMKATPGGRVELEDATKTGRKYVGEDNLLGALCWPDEDGRHKGKLRHFDQCSKKCVLNITDENAPEEPVGVQTTHWNAGCKKNEKETKTEVSCSPQLGLTLWNYSNEKSGGGIKTHCVPLPDYSRFSLDPTQLAAINLTLLGSNQGNVAYDAIDQSGLGPLRDFIAAGNRTAGIPFPKLGVTAKGTTTFAMSVQMPQTIFKSRSLSCDDDPKHPELCTPPPRRPANRPPLAGRRPPPAAPQNDVANAADATDALREAVTSSRVAEPSPRVAGRSPVAQQERSPAAQQEDDTNESERRNYNYQRRLDMPVKPPKKASAPVKTTLPSDYLTRREFQLVKDEFLPREQFRSGCGDNGVMPLDDTRGVDYLALKDMLHNIVGQQNDDVTFRGGPEIALDELVLTSAFQISLDTSAATYNIFRILPSASPPLMGVKPDHTHTLKITLKGAKKRGDSGNRARLFASCAQRLYNRRDPVPQEALEFCNSPKGLLLESIAQSVEQSKSGGADSP